MNNKEKISEKDKKIYLYIIIGGLIVFLILFIIAYIDLHNKLIKYKSNFCPKLIKTNTVTEECLIMLSFSLSISLILHSIPFKEIFKK